MYNNKKIQTNFKKTMKELECLQKINFIVYFF